MPNGGKLTIHLSNVTLDKIHAKWNSELKPGPYILAEVADTGSGISKEVQGRLFEPFFTTKGPSKGTGLGLSTTYGIVKSHGGSINCYSELGKGTVFNVYLPANTIDTAADGVTVHLTRLPRGNNELVLLVDDEESIREITQRTLEHFGFRVLTAVNGAEAVSIYKNRQPEIAVVLTDMSMPVMDGLAATIALKSINPDVKIIAASGLSAEGEKVKEIGIQQFVSKPYTAEVLLDALHQELRPKILV
jgi:CheY-like chemotaxis protein